MGIHSIAFSYTAYPDGCFNLAGQVNVSNVIYSSVYFHCVVSDDLFVELFNAVELTRLSRNQLVRKLFGEKLV